MGNVGRELVRAVEQGWNEKPDKTQRVHLFKLSSQIYSHNQPRRVRAAERLINGK